MKVAVYSAHDFELPYLEKAISKDHSVTYTKHELSDVTIYFSQGCDAVALFTSDKADEGVLEKLNAIGIKNIVLRSVGFDHVDLIKAKELGMRIANVPAYSPYSVAEHAVTLLTAINRKLIQSRALINKNDFRLDGLTGFDLHEKTVGIIGLGKIGEIFAKIMNGFGCKLLCYDPHLKQSDNYSFKIENVSLKKLCAESDIISIHCPLNKYTKHLLNASVFSLMKKGIYIINTARGAIIKTEDLFTFLDNDLIGGLGLDVYEFEKGLFFHDHSKDGVKDAILQKLRAYPNVLITGHQAFLTETALKNIADTTAYNLSCFEKEIPCKNIIL
ncbi:MAG: 2-hydroxyacid dehydrogenase [Bacteroidia bacterium]|nr:2-hydroxyacid dehydrogenase [Bacteroidia bacterium]